MIDDVIASSGTFEVTGINALGRNVSCVTVPTPLVGVPVAYRASIRCTLNEDLAVGEAWDMEIGVAADETQDINNVADAEIYGALDPDYANNHAEVAHAVTDVSDLRLTKTATGTWQDPGTCDTVTTRPNQVTAGLKLKSVTETNWLR